MEGRADDLGGERDDLPVPGTEEPTGGEDVGRDTEGPGNVSVDEPTEGTGSPGGWSPDEDQPSPG